MASEAGEIAARLRTEFRHALQDRQLIGYFQPEVELSTGQLVAAELLARWEHPELGTLQPSSFISLAEELGLMTELSLEMLRQALVQHRVWAAAGWLVPVSVNIGPGCVADSDFPAAVSRLLAEEQVPGQVITLEVSEETGTTAASTRFFAQLADSGIQISLDDFGTGFASLESLGGWPINELKLDSSIVRPIISSSTFQTIVRTTIDLAHQLGVKVVGEGVESAAISSELLALGCDIGQGFHLGRPMSAAAFTEWLRDPATLVLPMQASGYPQLSPVEHRADPGGLVRAPVSCAVRALRRAVQQVGRGALGTAVLVLLIYGLWQMLRWGGRGHQAFIGDLAFIPVNGAAAVLAWRVSRRADLGYRTCRAWRLLSLAMLLYLLGDVVQFWIENVMHRVAYPTWSDAAYLGFYVVAFCGLVSFPARRGSGPERLRLLLDLGTVFTGGAVLIWYLALGPAVGSGLHFDLFDMVTYAYPVGDLLLLFGILTLLWRGVPQSSVTALRIFGRPAALHRGRPHLCLHHGALDLSRRRSGRHPVDARSDRGLHFRRQPAAHQAHRGHGGAAGFRSRAAVLPALRGRPELLPPAGLRRLAQRRVQPAGRRAARRPRADLPGQLPSVHRPARLRPACGAIPAARLDRRHDRPVQPAALHGNRRGRLRPRPAPPTAGGRADDRR
jgi:EAL domain-containing protein (putative c-di-GMP-specific phosphodiesterase class I)